MRLPFCSACVSQALRTLTSIHNPKAAPPVSLCLIPSPKGISPAAGALLRKDTRPCWPATWPTCRSSSAGRTTSCCWQNGLRTSEGGKRNGMRAIDATTFRVGDLFAWHRRVALSLGRDATVQPLAGLKNPFRIPLAGFECGVKSKLDSENRSCSRRPGGRIGSWLRRRGRAAPHATAERCHMDHGVVGGIELDPLDV